MMPLARSLLLIPLALFAQGCMMVPIPTAEHDSSHLPGRANVKPAMIESIRPGVTTRAEVLLALGEPDGVFADDRAFVYLWSKAAGYLLWMIYAGPGSAAGSETIGKAYALVIEFDDSGLVLRRDVHAKNNWTNWGGPNIDRVYFPDVLRDPTSRPAAR